MFKIMLWAAPILLLAIGAIAFLVGTTAVYEFVTPLNETALTGSMSALKGMLVQDSERAGTSAAMLTADAELRSLATKGGEVSAAQKEKLLQKGKGFQKPAFAVLVSKDGLVKARAGIDPKLPKQIQGIPWVKDCLSGVVRDGLHIIDDKPFLLGAAPFMDANGAVGMVALGWSYDDDVMEVFAKKAGAQVLLFNKERKAVAQSKGLSDEMVALTLSSETSAELDLKLPALPEVDLPLPVLVNVNRYSSLTLPLFAGSNAFTVSVVSDLNSSFAFMAYGQLALVIAVFFLFLFMAWSVISIQRSISKPMEIITDHLGQHTQGANVGIIPEAGLSGPFSRLAKQINMILQGSPRPTSPVSPPVGDSTSPPFMPTPSAPIPTGAGLAGPPSADLPGDAFPSPPASAEESNPNIAPMGQAPVSDDLASSALAGLFDDGGTADPLAAFRTDAPVSGPPISGPPVPGPPAPAPSSAASLPGMGMGMQSQPPVAAAPPAADDGLNSEATVMLQVPQELIQESAAVPSSPSGMPVSAAPPVPAAPIEARTVIAQIPQELLSAAAPKPSVADEDTAHYKEVYQDFIRTRQQCAEDTSDLTYDRFVAKLMKNRQQIVDKYKCRSVRFQVYVKAGKAALRAVPVRD
ncbi:MAG: hypothetical protein GY822_01610 [Deltaproteobacteria bacterium]|nr:hypothetical protein [Deltaproteobacteria bacterium]